MIRVGRDRGAPRTPRTVRALDGGSRECQDSKDRLSLWKSRLWKSSPSTAVLTGCRHRDCTIELYDPGFRASCRAPATLAADYVASRGAGAFW